MGTRAGAWQRIFHTTASILILGLLTSHPALARPVLDPPPGPKIMVVSANLRESHASWTDDITGAAFSDLYYMTELTNFVEHLARHVPSPPDVLLLQEVNGLSARETAERLTEKFELPYRVVVAGQDFENQIGVKGDGLKHKKNTAILANSAQIEVVGKAGFMTLTAAPTDWSPYLSHVSQDQAHALLRDRTSGVELGAMSIHWVTTPHFRSDSVAEARRVAWARQTRRFMATELRDADIHVMGGEFSLLRCGVWIERRRCDEHPAYEVLTRGPFDDAVLSVAKSIRQFRRQAENRKEKIHRIDYVFTSGEVYAASRSVDYEAARFTPNYFSDHKYDYALIGP